MERRIVFRGQNEIALEAFEPPVAGPGEVRLRTLRTLISAGTEGIVLHRRFAPDTHWDRWVRYPFFPGYCAVSVVEAVGPGVEGFAVGDRVASRTGHASVAVVAADRAFAVPAGARTEDLPWFALAKIALVGARAAEFRLEDGVLIIGAGPIGQMALRWALAAGTRAVALDPLAPRVEHSARGGASATVALPAAGAREAVIGALGEAPRVVIDTTGHPAVFAAALGLVADRGRVVVLGDAPAPAEQRLTSDVITRGLTIVGAHDVHLPETAGSYAPFFDLLARGRFPLGGLTTHVFRPEEFGKAYALVTTTGDAMGVAFDWTD